MPTRAISIEDGNIGSKSIITAKKRNYLDIDLTFKNRPSGDIFKKAHGASVKQGVRNLLMTNFSEKPFLPNFGGNLNSLLFALSTEVDEIGLEDKIIETIEIFEPRAQVLNVSSVIQPDKHNVVVTVTFKVIATNETLTTNLSLTRLR